MDYIVVGFLIIINILILFLLWPHRISDFELTHIVKTRKLLAEAEDMYRNLTENSLVGVYITQDGKFIYANKKFLELLGYSQNEFLGTNVTDHIYPEDVPLIVENVRDRINDITATTHYQCRFLKKDKTILHVETFGSAMIHKDKPAAIGTIVDITARKKAEETIEYLAYYDSLTGLYNRNYIYKQLNTAISDLETEKAAVLFFDLDRFKFINDSMGHIIGDYLLKAVADRLKNSAYKQIHLARYGGDEFIAVLPFHEINEVIETASQTLTCFLEPFYIQQYEIYITPSIGISFYPDDGKNSETLLKNADIALYEAKQKGKNNFQFYRSYQTDFMKGKLEIESDLRKATEQEEYQLYYQPKLSLTTGKIIGVEALIRWEHPEKGFISPADFIPLAEETGLILSIGEWALRTACKQNKSWQDQGLAQVTVSVNLSVRQLYQPNLVEMVKRVLVETGLEPKYLELEITESMLMDSQHGLSVLQQLKGLGVQISLDDFGTGYSSLHYLKEFPIDKLKIDQSFIRNCTVDKSDATIVKTIIAMAHQLNLKVVAEGVEQRDHLLFLQRNLCNEVQGYLFTKPLPPHELFQKYDEIEQVIAHYGIPQELSNQRWVKEALHVTQQELADTVRLQQGMTFKFVKIDGKYIHTLCDGELLKRMGLIPEDVVGKELHDFVSDKEIGDKTRYYQRAWQGEDDVMYEGKINGVAYIASLRPIRRGGQIVEVIGTCVAVTERKQAADVF